MCSAVYKWNYELALESKEIVGKFMPFFLQTYSSCVVQSNREWNVVGFPEPVHRIPVDISRDKWVLFTSASIVIWILKCNVHSQKESPSSSLTFQPSSPLFPRNAQSPFWRVPSFSASPDVWTNSFRSANTIWSITRVPLPRIRSSSCKLANRLRRICPTYNVAS